MKERRPLAWECYVMISVFTTFIRRLGSDRNGLDKQLFASVWNRLRGVLISELKARGLWNASPRYLGVVEGASWSHQGALEELLAECYSFIFVRRIHALHTQLQSKDNIDGLVFRNVRNFLTNEQKKHDPLGFRVFHVVRSAVQRSIANASLFVSGDGLNIRNGTVLQFHAESEAKPAVSFEVATHIQAWSDELLPELVTARGAELESVVEKLRGFLVDLRAEQIRAFRLKDVVDPLKRDVRHRWERLWSHSEGETARDENEDGSTVRTRIVYQVSSFEERQEFEALFACVTDLLSCHIPLESPQLGKGAQAIRPDSAGTLSLGVPRIADKIEDCRRIALDPENAAVANAAFVIDERQ